MAASADRHQHPQRQVFSLGTGDAPSAFTGRRGQRWQDQEAGESQREDPELTGVHKEEEPSEELMLRNNTT